MDLAKYYDEVSPGVLILVGIALVVIPDPATSLFGAGLLLLGLAWLAYEWNR